MPHDFALSLEQDSGTLLRPVTTRWLPPTPVEEGGAFARPFVPGESRHDAWPPEGRDAAAAPEETSGPAAAAPAEVPMPWEEEDAWAGAVPEIGRAAAPWADEMPGLEGTAEADRPFPLDAFLIPENTTRLPAGLEGDRELQDRIAADVADALSAMVAKLRAEGLDALLTPSARREPVDVVLAAVLSGYLSRRTP